MKTSLLCCILFACDASSAGHASCPAGVIVATSDYGTSSQVGVLPLDGEPPALISSSVLGVDPALASSSGRRFFIERDREQNIFELDACGYAKATFASHSPSESFVDPQDVAVADDASLWVARLFSRSALVIGATNTEIDLSSADADGIPNMSAVRIVGANAFFALARLDDGDPNRVARQLAMMAVIDTRAHVIGELVTLPGRNPFGSMSLVGVRVMLPAIEGSTSTMSSTVVSQAGRLGVEASSARARWR